MNGKVVTVNPSENYPGWLTIQLEGAELPILLHTNWRSYYGELQVGDEVEYEVGKSTSYPHVEDHLFLSKCRKVNNSE